MTGNSFVWDLGIADAYAGISKWLTATSQPCTYCILGAPATPPTGANKQAWHTYNDVKYSGTVYEIAAVNGYALGGSAMNTAAGTISTDTIQFKAGTGVPTVFTTTATISCTYACTDYVSTTSPVVTSQPLFSNHDLAGTQTATNGTLTLTWSSSGVFSITSSAAG